MLGISSQFQKKENKKVKLEDVKKMVKEKINDVVAVVSFTKEKEKLNKEENVGFGVNSKLRIKRKLKILTYLFRTHIPWICRYDLPSL